jgi:hypothetical protein
LANFRVKDRAFDLSNRLEALINIDLLNKSVLLITEERVKLQDGEKVVLSRNVRLSLNSELIVNLPDIVIRVVELKIFVFVK